MSLHRTAVGNIGSVRSRLIDEFTPTVALSDLQFRTRKRGQPTEVPQGTWKGSMVPKRRWILSVPGGCWGRTQFSVEQWGAAMADEVATGVWHVSPLPMGMERGGR
ncbi:hypothetical protein THAOC_15617, partial [Thalassiosira oceanica]